MVGIASSPFPDGAQDGRAPTEFFVGIDVSLDNMSICIMDERAVVIKQGKCSSAPEAIARFVRHQGRCIEHVGLETCSLSQWLHAGVTREKFRATVRETGHVRASLATMRSRRPTTTRGVLLSWSALAGSRLCTSKRPQPKTHVRCWRHASSSSAR